MFQLFTSISHMRIRQLCRPNYASGLASVFESTNPFLNDRLVAESLSVSHASVNSDVVMHHTVM